MHWKGKQGVRVFTLEFLYEVVDETVIGPSYQGKPCGTINGVRFIYQLYVGTGLQLQEDF